ncbi:hypothetical protein LTR66_017584 [Elasticomyces elasticus]|nr:hypothetical protein LTR66_017584 [Elasticomyces elasticus]
MRFGFAIPEVWTWERLKLSQGLSNAGFPARHEILSETKCATAAILRENVEALIGNGSKKSDVLKDVSKTHVANFDRGGGTLDVSIMTIETHAGAESESITRFKFIGSGASTPDGSEQLNNLFRRDLRKIIGRDWVDDIDKELKEAGNQMSIIDFVEGWTRGFEGFKSGKTDAAEYSSMSCLIEQNIYDGIVQEATDAIFRVDNPIMQYLHRYRKTYPNTQLEIFASGGGSCSDAFTNGLKNMNIPNSRVQHYGTGDVSMVLKGGPMLLNDRSVCKDNYICNRSYGLAVCKKYDRNNPVHRARAAQQIRSPEYYSSKNLRNAVELDSCVEWFVHIGEHGNEDMVTVEMQQVLRHPAKEGHPKDCAKGWNFGLAIYGTGDESIARTDDHGIDNKVIKEEEYFKVDIDRTLAHQIGGDYTGQVNGWRKARNGDWLLEFDYKLIYRWAGLCSIFEVIIPLGGHFEPDDDGRLPQITRKQFMLATDTRVAADYGRNAMELHE